MTYRIVNKLSLKKLLIRDRSEINENTTFKIINDFVKEENIEFLAYHVGDYKDYYEDECSDQTS